MESKEEKMLIEADKILASKLEIIDSEIWEEVDSNKNKVEEILEHNDFKTIIPKESLKLEHLELLSQKYTYDCWVAAIHNLLKSANIEYDYFELMKALKTTTLWWTFPKNIDEFLLKYKESDFKIWVALVSADKFYLENEDYWHYVNIIWYEDGKYTIFDPWDWIYYEISEKDFNETTLGVLVWWKKRFFNVKYWKTFIQK